MNIKKIIKEEIRKIFNEDFDYAGEERAYHDKMQNQEIMNGIVGADILNYYPFSELPETRNDAHEGFYRNGLPGWGKVYIPSITDGNALTAVLSKADLTGMYWPAKKRTQPLQDLQAQKDDGYIELFKRANGEEPIFVINPDEVWYNKVKVVNPEFVEKRADYVKRKGDALGEEKISDKIVDKKTMDTPTGTLFIMNMAENESKKNNKRRN